MPPMPCNFPRPRARFADLPEVFPFGLNSSTWLAPGSATKRFPAGSSATALGERSLISGSS